MLTATSQNFHFKSWLLWVAFLISFPWVAFGLIEWLHPHGGWPGVYSSISGFISLVILAVAWFRGVREVVFVFVVFLVSITAIAVPLARASGVKDNQSLEPPRVGAFSSAATVRPFAVTRVYFSLGVTPM